MKELYIIILCSDLLDAFFDRGDTTHEHLIVQKYDRSCQICQKNDVAHELEKATRKAEWEMLKIDKKNTFYI